ncbi:MAG TPA: OmpA family protein, partial [Candidatus Acidoferrales bacterium]|nr:OmpA family protein [Candidatus Acidoferrales bacterium]
VSSTPAAQNAAPAPAAPTVRLQASPPTITKGGSAVLTWSSSNANQLTLSPSGGSVAGEGSEKVSPNESMTYTIRASGPGGSATATASVEVSVRTTDSGNTTAMGDQSFAGNVKDAFYDFNKADIRADARAALSHDAEYLREHPEIKIVIQGHCDDRGGEEYNIGLGDRRATEAKEYLVSQGISADRIQTVSLGKEQPFCTADNDDCWQQNRRGHLVGKP